MDTNPLNVNRLQEWFQSRQLPLPQYEFVQSGASHVPQFTGTVRITTSMGADGTRDINTPTFYSRKADAKSAAAYAALQYLESSMGAAGTTTVPSFMRAFGSPAQQTERSQASAPAAAGVFTSPTAASSDILPAVPGAVARVHQPPSLEVLERVILVDLTDPRVRGPHFAPQSVDFVVGFSTAAPPAGGADHSIGFPVVYHAHHSSQAIDTMVLA
jgi:hypothetical protein